MTDGELQDRLQEDGSYYGHVNIQWWRLTFEDNKAKGRQDLIDYQIDMWRQKMSGHFDPRRTQWYIEWAEANFTEVQPIEEITL